MTAKVYDTFEDELEAIRLGLYEATRDMTPEEELAYIRADVEPAYRQFNITRSSLKPLKPLKRQRVTA